MGRKLYVGNLPYSATEQELTDKFGACGTVEVVKLITDRDTGKCKGFGFIEMASNSEAQAAIDGLNGSDYDGRPMKVNEARPQENAPAVAGVGTAAAEIAGNPSPDNYDSTTIRACPPSSGQA